MERENFVKAIEETIKGLEEHKTKIRMMHVIFETDEGDIHRNAVADSFHSLFGFISFNLELEKTKQIQNQLMAEAIQKQKTGIIPATPRIIKQ